MWPATLKVVPNGCVVSRLDRWWFSPHWFPLESLQVYRIWQKKNQKSGRTRDYLHQVDSCVEVAISRQKEHVSVEVGALLID